MSINIHKYIKYAINEAIKSFQKNRHGAIIIYKNQIIGQGFNTEKARGNILTNYKLVNSTHTIHAEIAAILDMYHRFKLKKFRSIIKNAILLVVRIPTNSENIYSINSFRNSKPCPKCHSVLDQLQIKKVYYSY